MKKSKRNFLLGSVFFVSLLLTKKFNITSNLLNKKIKVYKKKYSKVWLLDINDS